MIDNILQALACTLLIFAGTVSIIVIQIFWLWLSAGAIWGLFGFILTMCIILSMAVFTSW